MLVASSDGSFLIDRLGAGMVADQDLAVVVLDLRRRLRDEYGDTPAVIMLIDRAVSAYQDLIRVTPCGPRITESITPTFSFCALMTAWPTNLSDRTSLELIVVFTLDGAFAV